MRVLITGGGGQLADSLEKTCPAEREILILSRQQLDVSDAGAVTETFERQQTEVVINCAAYTAVDDAESERDRAFAVNARGAENVARAARQLGARMIHISTDFVFGGDKSRPYSVDDDTQPVNTYGASKLAGEVQAREVCLAGLTVLRTSWLYGAHGRNFVKTMLRLMRERDRLQVVADQVGSPTWAGFLADVIWRFAAQPSPGTYHWADAGVASWYDFALAVQEEAMRQGLLTKAVPVEPVMTEDYPTRARRPAYSVLDSRLAQARLGIRPAHWRSNLRRMLAEMQDE